MPQSGTGRDASQLPVLASEMTPRELDQDVQLTIVLPRRVRQALLQHAAGRGMTARSVVLRLLKDAGIADVDEAELVDRRSIPNTSRKAAGSIR